MKPLTGTRVALRETREGDVEAIARAMTSEMRGAATYERVHENVRRRVTGEIVFDGIELAIEVDGRLVGSVQARRGFLPTGVFEIGVSVFDETDRGRGLGRDAVTALVRHLFDVRDAHRVQLTTDLHNGPMRAVAEHLGFREEGVLRRFWPREDGEPLDFVMCAMTKDDYEEVSNEWT